VWIIHFLAIGIFFFSSEIETRSCQHMLQALASAFVTSHPRRQAAHTIFFILLVCGWFFWMLDDNVPANLFPKKDRVQNFQEAGRFEHSVPSLLYKRAPPSAIVVSVPQAPPERELPDNFLVALAEIDAIFNINQMMLPPPPVPSSQTVELAADGRIDFGEFAKHDRLKPTQLPHFTSANAEAAASEQFNDLDFEPDAETCGDCGW
jgi:hypothetical protein